LTQLTRTLFSLLFVFVIGTASVRAQIPWHATMTVGHIPATNTSDGTERFGYQVPGSANSAGSLVPSEFALDGQEYHVGYVLLVRRDAESLGMIAGIGPKPPDSLTLWVDGVPYPLGTAAITTEVTGGYQYYQWPPPSEVWTVGQRVAVEINDTPAVPALPLAGVLLLFGLLVGCRYHRERASGTLFE